MRKTRKKKTRTGSKFAAVVLLCAFGLLCAAAAKDRKPAAYAVVAGTVFSDSGLALPGAEVELTAAAQGPEMRKFKKMKATSDTRGEFAFRVPPDAADYKVTVKAAGYEAQEKPVSVAGEIRMDVFFRLEPASNTERKR